MMDFPSLIANLETDEGFRGYLYDDANGHKIGPGVIVRGHPTCGYGFALDVSPLTQSEALGILSSRATDAYNTLLVAAPWVAELSEPRQRALANMAYNLGVTGLLKFDTFMALMQKGNFADAADDLTKTVWAGQVGARARRIQSLIENG